MYSACSEHWGDDRPLSGRCVFCEVPAAADRLRVAQSERDDAAQRFEALEQALFEIVSEEKVVPELEWQAGYEAGLNHTLEVTVTRRELSEIAAFWADEIVGNETRFANFAMPPRFRELVIGRLVSEHGWPDHESANAFVDELEGA